MHLAVHSFVRMQVETPHPGPMPPRCCLRGDERGWHERLCVAVERAPPGTSRTAGAGQQMRLVSQLRDTVVSAERQRLTFASGARLTCMLPAFVDLQSLRGHELELVATQTLGGEVTSELVLSHEAKPLLWLLDGWLGHARSVPEPLLPVAPRLAAELHPHKTGSATVEHWTLWGRDFGTQRSFLAVAS